jgi:indolepyruvate ferredoxin oxidoreductase beta subunit
MIVNRYELIPPIAALKDFNYPRDSIEKLKLLTDNVYIIDAMDIAIKLGNHRLVNTVLLGVLSAHLNISESIWEKIIQKRVPKGTESLNLKALRAGREVS